MIIKNRITARTQLGISSMVVLVAAILVVGVSYLVLKSDTRPKDQNTTIKNIAQNNETPKPTPTPSFPIDTVNDGVYTNYKYGFTFKYPNNILVAQNGNGPVFWLSQDVQSIHQVDKNGFWIELIIRDSYEGEIRGHRNKFDTMYEHGIGNYKDVLNILSIRQLSDYKTLKYHYLATGPREYSESFTHFIKKGDVPLIEIGIVTISRSNLLSKQVYILDGILNSVEFFDTNNLPSDLQQDDKSVSNVSN